MAISPDEAIERAVGGDEDAMTKLLRGHGPQVRRRLHIGKTWQASLDAADVMQVTYLEAFLRIGELQNRTAEGFLAWLTRIAENNLRDAIRESGRGKRPDRRRQALPSPDESWRTLLETISTTTASRSLAIVEAKRLLEAAIHRLPETYQKVVRLYELEGHSAEDVGHMLGRSTGAVYMLRTRALDRLRKLLGSESRFFSDHA